jgi:hypothetical protein
VRYVDRATFLNQFTQPEQRQHAMERLAQHQQTLVEGHRFRALASWFFFGLVTLAYAVMSLVPQAAYALIMLSCFTWLLTCIWLGQTLRHANQMKNIAVKMSLLGGADLTALDDGVVVNPLLHLPPSTDLHPGEIIYNHTPAVVSQVWLAWLNILWWSLLLILTLPLVDLFTAEPWWVLGLVGSFVGLNGLYWYSLHAPFTQFASLHQYALRQRDQRRPWYKNSKGYRSLRAYGIWAKRQLKRWWARRQV